MTTITHHDSNGTLPEQQAMPNPDRQEIGAISAESCPKCGQRIQASGAKKSSVLFRDAAGRLCDPNVDQVWTVTEIKAAFVDAVSSGFIADAEILYYRWHEPGPSLHAVVRNVISCRVTVYRMNPGTGRPYPVVMTVCPAA